MINQKRLNIYWRHLPAFLIFVALSLLLFMPWLLKPNGVIIAVPGDPLGISELWRTRIALLNDQSLSFTRLLAAPYGFSSDPIPYYLWQGLLYPMIVLLGEVFTYNFFLFISFPLAGLTMYFLVWHITSNRAASFVAGFIFTFSTYHLMHSLQHLTLANIQWLPLFFLSLIKLKEKRTFANEALFVSSFAILFLSDYYYGFFTIITTAVLAIFLFVYFHKRFFLRQPINSNRKRMRFFIVMMVALAILVTAVFPIISHWGKAVAKFNRSTDEVQIYSARPLEYLIPSIDNPFFGRYIEKFAISRLHNSNSFEQTLYLGLIPLALAAIAIYGYRHETDERRRFATFLAIAGMLTTFFLSLPPKVHLFGFTILMPSYLAHKIVPVFRVYARFGIFVMMFIAMLAGIGLRTLLERINSKQIKLLLVMIILVIVGIEFINIPPWHVIDVSSKAAPKVYRWLAKQPGDFIVAEYPWTARIELPNLEYSFYQRIHKKRLANGAAEGSYANKVHQNMIDLEDSDIGIKLYRLGVKYIVVHRQKYKEGMIPNRLKRYYGGPTSAINQVKYNFARIPKISAKNIILVKRFGNDYVYIVRAISGGTESAWGKNVYSTEYFLNSKRRWMSKGELLVTSYNKKPIIANINIDTFSFYKRRKIEVTLGSKLLKREIVGTKAGF